MRLTQAGLAEELNARQQTVSEWETGRYRPRGPSARLLTLIAEQAGFEYRAGGRSRAQRSPVGDKGAKVGGEGARAQAPSAAASPKKGAADGPQDGPPQDAPPKDGPKDGPKDRPQDRPRGERRPPGGR